MPGDRAEAALVRLRAIYDRAARAIGATPTLFCGKSGRCCRFREAGHELFLSALEFSEMAMRGGPREGEGIDACPWLEEGLCANREGRALACRTYFCSDEAAAAAITERFHAEIRALHEELSIPYEYAPLRNFLARNPSKGA